MSDNTFPVIRDVDGVLASPGIPTKGGIMTIKPPRYALTVTNPETPGDNLVTTKGNV